MASIGSLSVTLGLSSSSFLSGLSRASGALSNFAGQARSVFASISGSGAFGGGLAGAFGLYEFGKAAVQAAADMESLELSFQGIAGGAQQAKDLVQDIAKFAAETPFETMPLADSVKLLSTMGFEAREALEIIKRLGDVVAASGQGSEGLNRIAIALGQIRLMGRLQGQDAMQLTNAGIPIWDALAKRLGKTTAEVRKQSEAGGIDARTAILAVLDVANDPKFKGSQDRLSRSLNGLWSTLKDNTTLALADLGKIIAESFDLKGTANEITNFIGFLRTQLDGLKPILSLVGAGFGALRDTVLTALRDITEGLRGWGLSIDGSANRLAEVRTAAINFFEAVAKSINSLINNMKRFGGTVLEHVIAPLLETLNLADKLNPGSFMEVIKSGGLSLAIGAHALPSKKAEDIIKAIRAQGKALQATDLNAGNEGIAAFFSRVRGNGPNAMLQRAGQWLGSGIGLAQALGILPSKGTGELALSGLTAQGMAKEIKFAGAAERGSQEAYSNAVRDMAQRTGGKGSIADKLDANNKKTDDANKLLEKIKDAIAANWLGVATGIL